MKQIQPIQIWTNGQVQTGNYINAYIINDNLSDAATFYWAIYTSEIDPVKISEGNLTIIDPAYDTWGQSSDINQAAYEWIAEQLNLTLIA